MKRDRLAPFGPLAQFGLTFAIGATAGFAVLVWITWQSPQWGTGLFDLFGNGLDAFDATTVAWLFGQVAVLLHHVLPGIARD